jgi:hypothetical protein
LFPIPCNGISLTGTEISEDRVSSDERPRIQNAKDEDPRGAMTMNAIQAAVLALNDFAISGDFTTFSIPLRRELSSGVSLNPSRQ